MRAVYRIDPDFAKIKALTFSVSTLKYWRAQEDSNSRARA